MRRLIRIESKIVHKKNTTKNLFNRITRIVYKMYIKNKINLFNII